MHAIVQMNVHLKNNNVCACVCLCVYVYIHTYKVSGKIWANIIAIITCGG